MPLIDSHAHLAFFYREGRLETTLQNAEEAGVERFVNIGTSIEDWDLNCDLTVRYPEKIGYTVGLHPCEVKEDWEEQLLQLAPFFAKDPTPLALGEIGLDHFHLPQFAVEATAVKVRQVEAFKRQLAHAQQFDCPIIVHSRKAFHDCVKVIDESGFDWSKVVFHCFADGAKEVRTLNERGGRGSFTGIVTYKNAQSVRDALLVQGLETLMLESDAPYLAPVPKRGRPNEPAYMHHTAVFCAALFSLDLPSFVEKVTANTRTFFGFV